MPKKLFASYTDPIYEQLRSSFSQRSDDFPVVMLPIRLETRFMDETRYVTTYVPGKIYIDRVIKDVYKLVFKIRTWFPTIGNKSNSTLTTEFNSFTKIFSRSLKNAGKIQELSKDEKSNLVEAVEALQDELNQLLVSDVNTRSWRSEIEKFLNDLAQVVNSIQSSTYSDYVKGYEYLDTLTALEREIDDIYVERKATPLNLNQKLDAIDKQINGLDELIKDPEFKATTGTIAKIKSKVSYIKRKQKKSNIRLLDYKHGYPGGRDLKSTEYALRAEINGLQAKVQAEHAPFMELINQMKSYSIRTLRFHVMKTHNVLRAQNKVGYQSYSELMKTKEWLYDQLYYIRERAHRPLDGEYADVNDLKNDYKTLNAAVLRFIRKSNRIKVSDRYKKAALSRLETHLTEEYLKDLEELLPGVKEIEQQTLSDTKVRMTSSSSTKTEQSVKELRDFVKSATGSEDEVLYSIKSKLSEYGSKIQVSSSNTVLLPRTKQQSIISLMDSLEGQMQNMKDRNSIPDTHPVLVENKQTIANLRIQIENQQTDVFDAKDRFYDDYRKKITFKIKSETIKELWVRIYPDDISIDNHDERITDEEEIIGQDYYYEVYSKLASVREDYKLGAWRAAAASLGVRRAAYIIKSLLPQEVEDDNVPERVNALDDLLEETKRFARKKIIQEFNSPLYQREDFKEYINKLSGRLENDLKPTNFSICSENKSTLDALLTNFQRLHQELKKEVLKHLKSDPQVAQIVEDYGVLLLAAANIIGDFYKQNLEALNEPFKPELSFKTVEKKTKSWDRAGISEVMPDRFVVATKQNGSFKHIVTGKPIDKPLQVGLDPSSDQADRFAYDENGDLEVPQEIRWLFDFNAAVDAGMAVRIPLDNIDYTLGFETVLAFGVQDTTATEGQDALNKLLTNHLYSSGGLEYLPVGTATNNTDEVKSPYRAIDNDYDGAYDLFFNQSATYLNYGISSELKMTDGQMFRDALGIPDTIADVIRNNNKTDIAEGRAMNRALYNATLKYYFHVMIDNLVNSNDIAETLPFMMNHVSAVGNLPAFHVDGQPYGVLPIMPYSQFRVTGDTTAGTPSSYMKQLSFFLNATRAGFDLFKRKPKTVNDSSYNSNVQADFLNILGLEPYSKEFFYRFGTNLSGRWAEPPSELNDPFEFPVNWDDENIEHSPDNIAKHYKNQLKNLGHTTNATAGYAVKYSKAYINRYMQGHFINGSIVQDKAIEGDFLAEVNEANEEITNYISWLHDLSGKSSAFTDLKDMAIEDFPTVQVDGEDKPQNTLLFLMLRGALLYDRSIHAKNALDVLKELDVKKLERLLANHIDLCSYRLDAWMNGLSNYRLRELRSTETTGSYVGAYGFVRDLKPGSEQFTKTDLPAGLESTNGVDVKIDDENQGFIHGPSMNHAITAAVLRAGYNSLKERDDNNNALAINLSSARVRKALHLLEGVRNGQEAGALLGYMMERALHDKYTHDDKPLEMDVFIYRLRKKFPTFGELDKTDDLTQDEAIKAANVLDGLAMIEHFENELGEPTNDEDRSQTFVQRIISENGSITFDGLPWGFDNEIPRPDLANTEEEEELENLKLKALIYELDNMADAFDALGDLMTSEGVYQLVRGNHVRAAAVLNAMSEGKAPIDPEIIKSMRQGVMVTHRALLNIPHVASQNSPWSGVTMSPRALAEPTTNHWLAAHIGNPENVDWMAKYAETEAFISLEDLDMQPIDLVLLVASGGEDGMAEIEARAIKYLRANGAGADDDVELHYNTSSSSTKLSFGEMISVFRNLGSSILNSRIADARDYRIPEDEKNFGSIAAGIDTIALKSRLDASLTDYSDLYDSLSIFEVSKQAYTESETETAVTKLIELSGWGFSGFYPDEETTGDVMGMASKIISAKTKMLENITFVEGQLAALELEIDQTKWISVLTEITNRLYGNGFKIIPQVTLTNNVELRDQLDLSHTDGLMRNHEENYTDDWLSNVALVRKRMASIESVNLLGEVLFDKKESIGITQLPFDITLPEEDRDYWLGAEYPASFKPDSDRLSIVCFGHENVNTTISALVLDEWMEIIPDEIETTGVAMHYNQPDARAPQSVLLAVPPVKTGKWELDDIALSVEEALNMAKLRSVEPEHIDFSMFSQLLPATSTLAYGFDELARRLNPLDEQEDNDIGMYIDYTLVNNGIEPDQITENE